MQQVFFSCKVIPLNGPGCHCANMLFMSHERVLKLFCFS